MYGFGGPFNNQNNQQLPLNGFPLGGQQWGARNFGQFSASVSAFLQELACRYFQGAWVVSSLGFEKVAFDHTAPRNATAASLH